MSKEFNMNGAMASSAASAPQSEVQQDPERFARYQYDAMKHREIDLTELPDDPEFIENVLKVNHPTTQEGGIVCLLSYDATIKTCCLTGARFFPSVPLAFFLNADRNKPVCPHKALLDGFTMKRISLFAICRCLSADANLYHWIPAAYWHADRNDIGWTMDYRQFEWEPGDVIDDYYYMHLDDYETLLDMKRRGEPIERVNEPKSNGEDPDQLLFDFMKPASGVSVDDALAFLRVPAEPEANSDTVTKAGVSDTIRPIAKAA